MGPAPRVSPTSSRRAISRYAASRSRTYASTPSVKPFVRRTQSGKEIPRSAKTSQLRIKRPPSASCRRAAVVVLPDAGSPHIRTTSTPDTEVSAPGAAARQIVQPLLRPAPGLRREAAAVAVGQDDAARHAVLKLGVEDLADLHLQGRLEHGERDLDPAIEVAVHPVRGRQEVFRRPVVLEDEHPRVLEIAVDDGDHADPLGQSRD